MRPAWIAELEDDIAVAIVTKPTRQQIGCTQRQQQIAATERRQSKENDNLVSLGQHRLLDSTRSFSNGCQTNAQALSRCPNGSAVGYDPISLCSLNVVMGKWRASRSLITHQLELWRLRSDCSSALFQAEVHIQQSVLSDRCLAAVFAMGLCRIPAYSLI